MPSNNELFSKIQQAKLYFANLMDEYVDSSVFGIEQDPELNSKIYCLFESLEAIEYQISKGYYYSDPTTQALYAKIDCLVPIWNSEIDIDDTLILPFISNESVIYGPQGFRGPQGPQGNQGPRGFQGFQGAQGAIGPQGFQGFQGHQGPQGNQGPQGFIGPQGPQGFQGFQGNQGPQGPQGAQGNQGDQGPQGPQGFQGTQGNQGVQGPQGFQGFQGPQGFQGNQGNQGFQGPQGNQGNQGPQGNQGDQGPQGHQGDVGDQGPQGHQGDIGPQGDQGPQGPQGHQGDQGHQGPQGDIGPQGFQGDQGPLGPQGHQGDQGPQGPQGQQGPQGFQGFQGPQGFQGTQGFQGFQGPQGDQGYQGPAGYTSGLVYYFNQSENSDVSGYKVIDVDPLSTPEITVTTSLTGSQQNVLVSQFISPEIDAAVIPGGTQRFKLYFKKEASNDSIQAYVTIQLANSAGTPIGPVLTSAETLIGWVDSTTPIEVGCDLTLPTTVIDPTNRMIVKLYLNNDDATAHSVIWYTEDTSHYSFVITSLGAAVGNQGPQGPQGPQGTTGAQGNQGPQGFQGAPGNQGPAGPQGDQGSVGPTGPQGDQGNQGPAGPQGNQGPKGDQGDIGPTGPQGDVGVQGSQGPQGPIGAQGHQGHQGPAGPQGDIGPQGHQGVQGPIGPQGVQGPTGPQGLKGDQGFQGPAGPQGNQGFQGPTGPQGTQGPQGSASITNNVDNRVLTATGTAAINGEANLTFDGSTMTMQQGKLLVLSDSGGYGQFQINAPAGGEATVVFGSTGSGQNSGGYTNAGVIGLGAYGNTRSNFYFGAGYSGPSMFIPVGSAYVEAINSFRAPIFYDSNDTSYYVDPSAGGFNLRGGTSNRVTYTTNDSGFRVTNAEGNGVSDVRLGAAWGAPGIYSSSYLSLGSSSTYCEWRFSNNQAGYVNSSSQLFIGSVYDFNNTSYYLDPASTSVLNAIRFGTSSNSSTLSGNSDWGARFSTSDGWIQIGPANTGHAHIYTDRSNFYFNQQLIVNGGSTINQNDIRSAIFYDINNTGYYVDPASTSVLSAIDTGQAGTYNFFRTWTQLTGSHGFYSPVNGAHFYPNDSSYGSWKISGSRNGWGGIEVQYGSNGNITWMVNGTSNETGTHNNSYGWQYRFTSGGFYVSRNTYGGNESRVLQEDIWIGGKYFGSDGAIYGQTFYDSSDGSRYLDPVGVSRLNQVQFFNRISIGDGSLPFSNTGSPGVWLSYSGADSIFMGAQSSTVWGVYIDTWRLTLNNSGTLTATGDVVAYSDARVKENVKTIDSALEKVLSLRGVSYNRTDNEDKSTKIGVIAQETQKIVPEVVQEQEDGMLGVAYGNFAGLFIEAFKEQQLTISEQQKQIDELKELVNKLLNK